MYAAVLPPFPVEGDDTYGVLAGGDGVGHDSAALLNDGRVLYMHTSGNELYQTYYPDWDTFGLADNSGVSGPHPVASQIAASMLTPKATVYRMPDGGLYLSIGYGVGTTHYFRVYKSTSGTGQSAPGVSDWVLQSTVWSGAGYPLNSDWNQVSVGACTVVSGNRWVISIPGYYFSFIEVYTASVWSSENGAAGPWTERVKTTYPALDTGGYGFSRRIVKHAGELHWASCGNVNGAKCSHSTDGVTWTAYVVGGNSTTADPLFDEDGILYRWYISNNPGSWPMVGFQASILATPGDPTAVSDPSEVILNLSPMAANSGTDQYAVQGPTGEWALIRHGRILGRISPPPPEESPGESPGESPSAPPAGIFCATPGCSWGQPDTRVYIMDFCGRRIIGDVTDNATFLKWGRELDDDSEVELTLHLTGDAKGRACCGIMSNVRTWRNELMVVRGGEAVWGPGPIVTNVFQRHVIHVTSRDIIAWLDSRLVHTAYDFVQADLTHVAVTCIVDALTLGAAAQLPESERDACILDYMTFEDTGKLIDLEVLANRQTAGEILRQLAGQGLDFTVVNRSLHIGADFAFGPVGPLRDDHFSEDLQVAERGLAFANNWFVSSDNDQGNYGGPDDFYGLVEKGVEGQPAAAKEADMRRLAYDRWKRSSPPPLVVTVPSTGQLKPNAPLCPSVLVPGTMMDFSISEMCRTVETRERLTSVRVTLDDKGEHAGITVAPLGEAPAGEGEQ